MPYAAIPVAATAHAPEMNSRREAHGHSHPPSARRLVSPAGLHGAMGPSRPTSFETHLNFKAHLTADLAQRRIHSAIPNPDSSITAENANDHNANTGLEMSGVNMLPPIPE